ncbi:hypothetical protein P7D22_01780 [Lichenihabitans sp. Uapishka_5]|uniref:hypothetical protein n=1 Tax=Lichenihabitans sp. Uapishka_5 TaxID=3037302 RepID=UPI0029E7EF68|nr:hypothetical protein [Lichenihabitans sp. Uapishka_5]MDX7949905.1 hypothetical protein [Lichenihabitans sp. Uapishka_5]
MRAVSLFASPLALLAGPVQAQDADCTSFKWPMNREMTAFKGEGLPSVASGATLPGVSEAVTLKLVPQDSVGYAVSPGRTPKHAPAYGGTFTLPPFAAADTYQVTLSDEAWVDVEQNGKTVKQSGFTGSHSCKVVHKSVRFPMAVGPATIEISDAASDTLKLEVLPKEQ